jgi:hypothetical protein
VKPEFHAILRQPLASFAAGVAARYSVNRQHVQALLLIWQPDEFIQSGFRPGFFIDLFDDDRTIQGM